MVGSSEHRSLDWGRAWHLTGYFFNVRGEGEGAGVAKESRRDIFHFPRYYVQISCRTKRASKPS